MKLIILASLVEAARKTIEPLIANKAKYDKKLNCGECIASGYVFCHKANTPAEILSNKDYPIKNAGQICCEHNEDTKNCWDIVSGGDWNKRNKWLCSSSYENAAYSL